jgi:hypothetical protein
VIRVTDCSKSLSRKTSRVHQETRKAALKAQSDTRFKVGDAGIFARSRTGAWEQISSRVEVLAQTRDSAGENWGRLLQWDDSEGKLHEWTVPMELLIGDPAKVRAHLVRNGMPYINR